MAPDDDALEQLATRAGEVAAHAHVPVSGFRVGAAVLAADGSIHAGCNVENASHGLTLCAERAAVCAAVAAGARELVAVAVHTAAERPVPPCGACLQVLAEFGRTMTVVLAGPEGTRSRTTLDALLPRPFTFEDLGTR